MWLHAGASASRESGIEAAVDEADVADQELAALAAETVVDAVQDLRC